MAYGSRLTASGSRLTAPGSRLSILTALVTLLAWPLAAQVGYDPEHSPFRDIRKGSALAFGVGWFAGDAGTLLETTDRDQLLRVNADTHAALRGIEDLEAR